jgi:4-hydroxy-4-methyl-2-oxoglutarate aldolase
VRGLVTTGSVRDVGDLRAMGFPVWSAAVNAQGTVKATAGAVNVPITVGGAVVRAGDVIVADDDGVLCVPRGDVKTALDSADARVAKEAESRAAYLAGELSLDRNRLRGMLEEQGVRYLTAAEYEVEHVRD